MSIRLEIGYRGMTRTLSTRALHQRASNAVTALRIPASGLWIQSQARWKADWSRWRQDWRHWRSTIKHSKTSATVCSAVGEQMVPYTLLHQVVVIAEHHRSQHRQLQHSPMIQQSGFLVKQHLHQLAALPLHHVPVLREIPVEFPDMPLAKRLD